MRLHVIQHVPFEGPGLIAEWARERGYSVTVSDQSLGQAMPGVDAFDLLVLMGGPMSVNDEAEFAWLRPEKELIRQALKNDRKVLGVCLGSQMIASAMGKKVYKNPQKEIGWYPIESTGPFGVLEGLPRTLDVFHWHGETYDLPDGASHLFASAVCAHQGYSVGSQVLALQCHLEGTEASLKAMLEHGRAELDATQAYIQSEEAILAHLEKLSALKPYTYRLLDNFISLG